MLHQTQIQREAARERVALYKAAEWRAHADEMRERAKHACGETNAKAMARIAADFDFLAEFEERRRWFCL